jgi:class 3 adenylate cyclase
LLPLGLLGELAQEPGGSRARQLEGAILIADIAGYTRITERLCGLGDEGLGRLSEMLNREFSRYLDVVAEHDGEIVSFAGDALIASFRADGPASQVWRRALACADALAALSGGAPGTAEERVTLHIGIASGAIWVARLGGWYGRSEVLVGGDAVRGAFAAAASAGSGRVVARGPAAEFPYRPPAAESPPSLSEVPDGQWLDGLIHPRLLDEARGAMARGSELRHVTALFVRAMGLDERQPGALARYQNWVFAVHETLRTVAAVSGRFLIDDRGPVFVLVLGDPGNARADDLERVLSFALALEPRVRGLGFGVKMGLAAGRAFCGVIGNQVRRQYVTIGPAMNLAARLMDAATQGLLAGLPLPVHRAPRFKLIPVGDFELKGIGGAVSAARVEAHAGDPSTDLHGRHRETEALAALLEGARRGSGGLALVVGHAGMGKSSLVEWIRRHASETRVRCVVGSGDLTECASSYFSFRPVVRALLGAETHEAVDGLRSRLVSWLSSVGRGAEFAPLFNSLLPLQLPETSTTEQLRGHTRAEVLVELLVELVRRAALEPLAILIEDAHWMDSASVQLIDQLVSRLERPLVLLTARPEAEDAALSPLRRRTCRLRLEIGPLGAEGVAAIGGSICGGPLAPEAVAFIREQTQGNPFFVQEYVRQLRDTGRLALVADHWCLTGADQTLESAPPTLEGVIASRIDGLPPAAQRALGVAAVIGQQVDLSLMSEVLGPAESSDLTSMLDAFSRRQLVVAGDAADVGIRFAHALIQSVAYDSLLFERRKDLHRAVAEAIERREANALGHHVLLVHHWSRARNMVRTVSHAEAAAEESVQAGAYREARSFAELCVHQATLDASLATPSRQMRWELTLADAATGTGDVPLRGIHATNALALAGRWAPRSSTAALAEGALVLARRALRRLFLGSRASRSSDLTVGYVTRAYRQMAVVSFFANEPLRILYFAAHALVHAERGGRGPELSGALAEIGAWFGFAGMGSLARHYFGQAFELAAQEDDRPAEAHVHMVHSLYSVGRGHWRAVQAGVDRCQELCLRIGDRVQWANAQVIRFWSHYYQARLVEAERAACELEVCARESGNTQQMSWALHSRGLCGLAAGTVGDARQHLSRSLELIVDSTDRTAALSTQGSLALAEVLSGERERGLALAKGTLKELAAISRPMGHAMLEGLSDVAEVTIDELARAPRSPTAFADARIAVGLLRRQAIVFPIATPSFRYWQSRLRAIEGRDGTGPLRRGLRSARALGMAGEARRFEGGSGLPTVDRAKSDIT